MRRRCALIIAFVPLTGLFNGKHSMKRTVTVIFICFIAFAAIDLNVASVKAQLGEYAYANVLPSKGGTTDPPAGTYSYYVEYTFTNEVPLMAYPDNGFIFQYWEITSGNETTILYGNSTTISVGNGAYYNCTVQAVFQRIPSPKISILFPQNQKYNESSVPLVFTADKVINWTGYSLDGNQNVTISGNCTLTALTNGLHNITIYANDTYGNVGVSETVEFTVAKPELFPIAAVVAVSIAVAAFVVVVGLLVYFKKRT